MILQNNLGIVMGQIHSSKKVKNKVSVTELNDNVVKIDSQKNMGHITDIASSVINTVILDSCILDSRDIAKFDSALQKNNAIRYLSIQYLCCKTPEVENAFWSVLLRLTNLESFDFSFSQDSKITISDAINNIAKLIANNVFIDDLNLSFDKFGSALQDDYMMALCSAFVSARHLTKIKFDARFTQFSEDLLRLTHQYNQSIYQLDAVHCDTSYTADRSRMLNGSVDFWCEMVRGRVLMHYQVNRTCSEMLAHYPAFKYVLQYTFNHEVANTLHDDIFRMCPLLRLSSVCKSFYRLLEGEKPVAGSQTQSTLMNMPDDILQYIFSAVMSGIERRKTPEEFKLAVDALTVRL